MAEPADTVETPAESRPFEADVAKLPAHDGAFGLFGQDVFLRELIRMPPMPASDCAMNPSRSQSC